MSELNPTGPRNKRGDRARRQLSYVDPLQSGRHPFQLYILTLCFASGLPMLFGLQTAEAAEAALPTYMTVAWGAGLVAGSGTALVGCLWPRKRYDVSLALEQAGLGVVGFAAIIYALIIVVVTGSDRLVAAAITFAFGVASLRRYWDLQVIFRRAIDIGNGQDRATVAVEPDDLSLDESPDQDRRRRKTDRQGG